MRVRDDIGGKIKHMAETHRPSEIAKALNISRQLVDYHLKDKTRRRRANLSGKTVAELRAAANARYARRVLGDALE